jgi:hypothetical protein
MTVGIVSSNFTKQSQSFLLFLLIELISFFIDAPNLNPIELLMLFIP